MYIEQSFSNFDGVKNMIRKLLCFFLVAALVVIVGFSEELQTLEKSKERATILKQWEDELKKAMEEWNIPGMTAGIIYEDEVIYKNAFGVKDLSSMEPVDIETVFQIGSTTKAFTATLSAIFVDEGQFGWKDRVMKLYPEFRLKDISAQQGFLFEDLMAQHSGLYPYAGDILSIWGFGRDKVLSSLSEWPTMYSFRSDFSYVNNLFVVVEEILERYSGKSYSELLKEKIFDPLEMKNTHATLDDFLNANNAVTTHVNDGGNPVPINPEDGFIGWIKSLAPAGIISSNIYDMLKWVNMHLNKGTVDGEEIVSRENLLVTHSPHTFVLGNPSEPISAYCLGWVIEEFEGFKILWHNGDTAGCHAMILMIPKAQLGIVILSNMGSQEVPDILAKSFVQLVLGKEPELFDQLNKENSQENDGEDVEFYPHLPLEKYTGTYNNEIFEEVVIKIEDSGLKAVVANGSHELTLEHITRDYFTAHLLPYMKDINQLSFMMDKKGNIKGFYLTEPSSPDPYWFEKMDENN
ncbi:MAG: serine hydrolase [Kosmotoga sp.]|nr:MAG: serine hydrolase [Kosmotoga sp.]